MSGRVRESKPAADWASIMVVLAALVTVLPSRTDAQQLGTVVVHVTAATLPVADATVRSGAREVVTDPAGTASIELPAGQHALTVLKVGFAPVTVTVVVVAGGSARVDVALQEAAVELGAVVVSATRNERRVSDEPTRVEVTDRDDVEEQLTSSPGNIAELLTEASGVHVRTTSSGLGGVSVRIRGLQGRYTELLSDGLPLFGLTTEGLSPLQIPPIDLERVEVIKGVASALYGPTALGGVIDLVSRRPDNEGRLLLNQTSRDAQDAVLWNARQLGPAWGYTVVGSAHRQGGEDLDRDGWIDLAGYRRAVVRPRVFWTGSGGSSVFLTTGLVVEGRTGGTVPGATLPSGQPLPLTQDTWRGDLGGVGRFQLGPALRLSVRGSVTQQWRSGFFGTERQRERRNTLFGEIALAMERGSHVLVAGTAFERDGYTALDLPVLSYTYTSPGFFLQDTWTPAAWLGVTSSARLDAHNRYGTFLSPRVSLLVHHAEEWNLRLSAGTGEFTPTPFNEATAGIDPARLFPLSGLRAERGKGVSADLGSAVGPIELNGSVFASAVDHPVALRPVPGSTAVELVNADGPTRVWGAELFARYEHEPLTVTALYQYLRGTELDVASAVRRDVPFNPRHSGGLTVVWADDEGGARFGLEAYYTGTQTLADDPYRSVGRPYVTFDALAEVPVKRVTLFLHGEDLTDVRQSAFEPLLLPEAGPGGRWASDVWAPLAGRVINFGVFARL